jgi:hypothetical protein
MKTISLPWLLFWMFCLVLVAFIVGRHFERTKALQDDVGHLKDRVGQLETHNIRHEKRRNWISWVKPCVSWIPLLKHFFM